MTTRIAILGSTGSIGRQTLDVVRDFPDRFSVCALAAGSNVDLLTRQVREFQPEFVSTREPTHIDSPGSTRILQGQTGLLEIATLDTVDIVVVATSGHSAIQPTLAAIESGKDIALANKEVVVCAGELLMESAKAAGVTIRPVDSEHSAIWQCLGSCDSREHVSRLTITSSGGALRDYPVLSLGDVTVEQALAHPNWNMGPKVTIDSATLMNKGLEVIEAHWLFGVDYDDIEVAIHPQSIVHSLVTFVDGSTIAQLGIPDMRTPIQYALSYPDRLPAPDRHLDLTDLGRLEFSAPDRDRYPALSLAYEAGRIGGTHPTVLSAADDAAVDAFLGGQIRFCDIVNVVSHVLERHDPPGGALTFEQIQATDEWARRCAVDRIASLAS